MQPKCGRCRTRAMMVYVQWNCKGITRIRSCVGVCSVELQGDNKNQMVVTGDGIDAATLTSLVRKKVKHASLETVQQI
ncbi:hypothetical protein OSB04_015389 [Centaurea solstitialis]|uniref:HMA domain-containing protein n=1 Tax=Centaurea solstitialis TaxID=347529 RepID=A0AA38WIP5_9ASTR|nr:hypothetical protein OSB04_015389 [Centaurea solstitialis]